METIKSNKVKLIRWLRGDSMILQHVSSRSLITRDEYYRLRSIQDPVDKTTGLLDTIFDKGNARCFEFLGLLKEDDVNESIPELREWIKTVKTADQSLNTGETQTDSVAGLRTHSRAQGEVINISADNGSNLFTPVILGSNIGSMTINNAPRST